MSFTPQFKRGQVNALASRYNVEADEAPLAAGKAIKAGDFTRKHLSTIFEWKTGGRGRTRLSHNSEAEIGDALRLAVLAREPRSTISVLTGLYGVHVPVASAIATVIFPEIHTILDFRALEALGCTTKDRSVPFYLQYRAYCVELAEKWGVSVRTLDRALWRWSYEREPSGR